MKKIIQSKLTKIIVALLSLILLGIAAIFGYERFTNSRIQKLSPYYTILMNKHSSYTPAELEYMVQAHRYTDPFLFNENRYRKVYAPVSFEEMSDTEKEQIILWADDLQLEKPAELESNESWIPTTNLAIFIPDHWEQTYKDRQTTSETTGFPSTLALNSQDQSGAFVFFEIVNLEKEFTSLEEYSTSSGVKKFYKIDKSNFSFIDELHRQKALDFNRSMDSTYNYKNITEKTIDYNSHTINNRPVYLDQQLVNYKDGQVLESIYLYEIDGYFVAANAYYRIEDKEQHQKAVEEMIAKSHTFYLDFMREDEPSRHGITIEEENKLQENK
ncbi:hypothetical protein [Streptococcus moroccensis]|uniref:Uncharacterized protein n=1 Tax=Streptococcus moroccensis TaxID=1451356 RepID=A0ABT9YR95_9STRE|nr:hypothetical protein [Streptococcus moroccensis]MDQ0222519.1 hypothetical protein [Streptococcus moroccensis]